MLLNRALDFTPLNTEKMNLISRFCVVLSCFFAAFSVGDLQASDSAARLQASVHRMAFWLGTGEESAKWRQFLMLNHLDTQAALGDRADVHQLKMILERFEQDTDGLDQPAFVEVRDGLKRHIEFLSSFDRQMNFKSKLESAKFEPISREVVERYRDLVIYEYEVLIGHYRATMSSRERALLFFDLKTDRAMEVLSAIDMEVLMPEAELDIQIEPIDGPQPDDAEKKQDDETRKQKRKEWLDGLREISRALTAKNLEINDIYFGSTQLALDRFIRIYFFATDANSEKAFERELKNLMDNIDSLSDPNARAQHAIVGSSLGWMQSANQMPDLVSAVRSRHSLPNLYFSVSANLINQVASRPVAQHQHVNEMVLGRLIRGVASTYGTVTIDLVDNPFQAHVSPHFLATTTSDTRGGQGSIVACTTSSGQLEARRSIYANLSGFFAGDPYGAANLSSQFLGVNKSLKIVEKIAYKSYLEDKDAAEEIASTRAEKQIIDQFTKETNEVLTQGNVRFTELVDRVEPYAKLMPETYLSTMYSQLNVITQKANQFDLAANNMPTPTAFQTDMGFKLHETFLTNYLTPLFSGKTMSNQDMADRIYELGGTPPEGLEPENEDDKFSISFARIQPIKVDLDGDRLGVSIYGRRFAQGGRRINAALIISLKFKIVNEDGKFFLVKDGESSIEYGEGVVITARVAAFKNFLVEKLNETGANDVKVDLPANLLPVEDLGIDDHDDILKNMKLVQFISRDGWLQVGWNYLPGMAQTYLTEMPSIENKLTVEGTTDEYTPQDEQK